MAKLKSLQYQLINNPTGEPLKKSPYFLKLSDGTTHFGYTDEQGFTISVARETAVTSEMFVGEEALLMSEKE